VEVNFSGHLPHLMRVGLFGIKHKNLHDSLLVHKLAPGPSAETSVREIVLRTIEEWLQSETYAHQTGSPSWQRLVMRHLNYRLNEELYLLSD
jgi:hypothetical protein